MYLIVVNFFKTHSHKLHLMHAAAATCCGAKD